MRFLGWAVIRAKKHDALVKLMNSHKIQNSELSSNMKEVMRENKGLHHKLSLINEEVTTLRGIINEMEGEENVG